MTSGPLVASPPGSWRARTRPWWPTAVVLLVSVVALVVVGLLGYRDFHPIIDAVTYRAQADALLDGELTLDGQPGGPFVFTAGHDGEVISKYLPGTAALGAASLALTGSLWPALVLVLALLVVATAGVAAEAGLGPRARAVAAGLVGLSPTVLALDARLLSYVPAAALLTAGLWAALVARRRGSAAALVGAGALLGAALLVRQLEVLVWLVVVAVWLGVTAGGARPAVRRLALLAAGVAPSVALIGLYTARVTGTAFRLPYLVVSPDDGPGFGLRRALETDPFVAYDLVGGVRAAGSGAVVLLVWVALGPLCVAGAVMALRRRTRSQVVVLLAALVVAVPLFQVLQWSHKNALRGGHYDAVGPFYLLPVVAPLVVLGVVGWAAVDRHLARRLLPPLVVACVVLQVLVLRPPVARQLQLDDRWAAARAELEQGAGAAESSASGAAVVLLDEAERGRAFPALADLGDDALPVVAAAPPQVAFAAVDRWPDRPVRQVGVRLVELEGREVPVPFLQPVVAEGPAPRLEATASVGCPAGDVGEVTVLLEGAPAATVPCGEGEEVRLVLVPGRAELWADGAPVAAVERPSGPGVLRLCAAAGDDGPPRQVCRRVATDLDDGRVRWLLPGVLDADAERRGTEAMVGPLRPSGPSGSS